MPSIQRALSSKSISSPNVHSITIRNPENNTKIDRIPNEIFSTFPKLKVLESDLKLTEIAANDLSNANELTELYVSYSKLRRLSAGWIQMATTKLERLSLHSNEIETIDDSTFSSLKSLKVLFLYENKLTVISRNTFSGLAELQKLYLSENAIHTIENGAFTDLKKLKELRLNQNKLRVLSDHIFDGPTALKSLTIASNQIANIEDVLFRLTAIEELDLEGNQIGDVDLVKFSKLPSLKQLNLKKTGLNLENVMYDSTIPSQSPLKSLNLAYCKLTSINDLEILRLFPNLERVDLSGTKQSSNIPTWKPTLRRFLPKLDVVDG